MNRESYVGLSSAQECGVFCLSVWGREFNNVIGGGGWGPWLAKDMAMIGSLFWQRSGTASNISCPSYEIWCDCHGPQRNAAVLALPVWDDIFISWTASKYTVLNLQVAILTDTLQLTFDGPQMHYEVHYSKWFELLGLKELCSNRLASSSPFGKLMFFN